MYKIYKKGALASQPQVIKFTSCIHANPTNLPGSLPNFKVFYRLPILDVFLPI
jgi:hypothetical protein